MGIKERREREKVHVKGQILSAARQIATKNGWPAVSIRKIADIIEYTPPVIYEHFNNKEAILSALEEQGFQQLRIALADARKQAQDPGQQLASMSAAYWDFAFAHPDLYQVMFNLEGIQSTPGDTGAIRHTGESVLETLRYLHAFPGGRENLFFTWWALCHGFVSLAMSGQLPIDLGIQKQHLLQAMDRFVQQIA